MSKLKLNQQIFDLIYPVGSVYLTVNDVNPEALFGGTWVKSSGGFIYGSTATGTRGENGNGTGTSVSSAGGGNTGSTAITIDQMPSHTHPHREWVFNGSSVNTGYHYGLNLAMNTGTWIDKNYAGDGELGFGNYYTGGNQGHTHTLSNHSHTIPYFACYIWKRTA